MVPDCEMVEVGPLVAAPLGEQVAVLLALESRFFLRRVSLAQKALCGALQLMRSLEMVEGALVAVALVVLK